MSVRCRAAGAVDPGRRRPGQERGAADQPAASGAWGPAEEPAWATAWGDSAGRGRPPQDTPASEQVRRGREQSRRRPASFPPSCGRPGLPERPPAAPGAWVSPMAAPEPGGTPPPPPPFPAPVAGEAELGQPRALTRLRAQLAPTGKLRVGVGSGAGNVCRPLRGRRREGGPRAGAQLAWPRGRGRKPARRGTARAPRRPQNSERARRAQSLLPKTVSLSGCRSCLLESDLQKAAQDSGKEIFIFPAGLFRASGPSGSLGKVGCGVGIALGLLGSFPTLGMGSARW